MICTTCNGSGCVNIDDGNLSLGWLRCTDCVPKFSTPEQRWVGTFAALAEHEKAERD